MRTYIEKPWRSQSALSMRERLALLALIVLISATFLFVQRWHALLCDHSTLVAGGSLDAEGFAGLCLGLFGIISVLGSVELARKPGESFTRQIWARNLWQIACLLFVASLGVWLDSLLTHYCAEPSAIIVHRSPLSSPVRYSWKDIARLAVGCRRAKAGYDIDFILTTKDGYLIQLGDQSWWMTWKHYPQIVSLLSQSQYVFDNHGAGGCPTDYRSWFSRRPS